MAIYFYYTEATRERLSTTDDLVALEGRLINYSFKDNTGFKKQGHTYYIYLNEFSCTFQIKADYLRFFNRPQFENNVKPNDRFKLTIPKYQEHLLRSSETVFITSLSVNSIEYITAERTLKADANSSGYNLAFLFAIGGVVSALFHKQLESFGNFWQKN